MRVIEDIHVYGQAILAGANVRDVEDMDRQY